MIKTIECLKEELVEYKNPLDKISRLAKDGEIIKLINGLYETNKEITGYYLAQVIYGPSYLSFEFALSFHGLIPEGVCNYTSATYNKKKKKHYSNYFGNFYYQDVSSDVYPYGIILYEKNGYNVQIASKEKALCDKLYSVSPVKNLKELSYLLLEDLRIDIGELLKLNLEDILFLSKKYKCTNVDFLYKYLRKMVKFYEDNN